MTADKIAMPGARDAKDTPAAPETAEERYAGELLSATLRIKDTFLSYKNEVRKEKISLSTQVERLLINMLETSDGLAGYIRQYEGRNVEGFAWVQTVYLDLQQKLERAGVAPMGTEAGEPYDEFRHEILNPAARPSGFEGRPAISRVVAPGYLLKSKVLRRARIEASWERAAGEQGR